MTTPVRLQLSRRAGFNLQEASRLRNGLEAVNVSRPSKWGNPFIVGFRRRWGCKGRLGYFDAPNAKQAVIEFRAKFEAEGRSAEPLRGKNLACWCRAGAPCHADVLLELANQPITCEATL